MKRFTIQDKGLKLISALFLIGVWSLLSLFVGKEVLIPSPLATLNSLIEIVGEEGFLKTVFYTMARSLGGFFSSLLLAVFFGGLSKWSRTVRLLFKPFAEFLSSVPVIAIILLALIWLHNSLVPLFVGFLVVFPIMYETVLSSLDGIDKGLLQMAKVYKVRKLALIRDIYIPVIFQGLSNISATTLSTTLKMVVAGEVLSQPGFSIGADLQLQRMYLNTAGVFAWIIVILVISKVLNVLVEKIKTGGRFSRLFWGENNQ
ncbi:ABC transporter permease [Gudongella sp. DL1XJH-153]|uniref:ABC transporter permease n=1 Tax=Gudongella sp. DL1XJH-153 TaxID=3409804 RepID=UPI003BB7333F